MKKKVYVVMENSDTTEGRGPMLLGGIFSNITAAKLYADSREPYGHSGQFHNVSPQDVYDTAEEHPKYMPPNRAEIKKEALAKLTPMERKVLGL